MINSTIRKLDVARMEEIKNFGTAIYKQKIRHRYKNVRK